MGKQVFDEQFVGIVSSFYSDIGTKNALWARDLLLAGDYESLVSLKVDPTGYSSWSNYLKDASAIDLIRKLDVDVGIDRKAVALRTFYECEHQNARTNVRMSRLLNGPWTPEDMLLVESLDRMRGFIRDVLGPLPRDLTPRFGPGVTFCRTGKQSLLPDKMAFSPSVTEKARCLLPLWQDTAWAHALFSDRPESSEPTTVPGNRFTTVPKDSSKDRGICIEPSINVSYQLAVGSHIRGRLKRIGIDLVLGQDIHRQVARESSMTQYFATIDLSNASDTIAAKLVRALVPCEWHDLLDVLRSPKTFVDGKWMHLQKFSSMGNGYTFELETLIFLAIARESYFLSDVDCDPGRNLWVYGDDMIVHHGCSNTCLLLLSELGFTPNKKKTFTSGPFRESCGGDFFDGKAVRPHYIKELPREPQQWISLANGLRRLAHQNDDASFCFSLIRRTWFRVLDALPSDIRRCRGPVSLGDLVIHDDNRFWTVKSEFGRHYCQGYGPVVKVLPWHHWTGSVVMACALYGSPSNHVQDLEGLVVDHGGYAPRKGFLPSSYRKQWLACLEHVPTN